MDIQSEQSGLPEVYISYLNHVLELSLSGPAMTAHGSLDPVNKKLSS
jgi:hypothetical protein